MRQRQKKSGAQGMLKGAFVLIGGTIIVKVIGMLYKMPLANILGGSGMGYYNTAYNLYIPLYSLSMAGLPIALSRMVAEQTAEGHYRDVRRLHLLALRLFFITGFVGTAVMLFLSKYYVNGVQNPQALPSIVAVAPSLLICCLMSAYRGYYEGMSNMYPTAVSQIIEAIGKLALGLLSVNYVMNRGMSEFRAGGTIFGRAVDFAGTYPTEEDAVRFLLPIASAAAIAGVTVGTAFGLVFLFIRRTFGGDGITKDMLSASPRPAAYSELLLRLMKISVPIVLGSLAMNVSTLVDSGTILNRLAQAVEANPVAVREMYGEALTNSVVYNGEISNFLYGVFSGLAITMYNLVPTVTAAMGISAIPAIASGWVRGRTREVNMRIESVLRMTALLSLPAGLGMSALAYPLLDVLFGSRPYEVQIAAPMLQYLGVVATFASLSMPITNMLQAVGRQAVPVRNMVIAAVIKLIVNFSTVSIPGINIYGAIAGTALCYLFLVFANLLELFRATGHYPSMVRVFIKPIAAAVMSAAAAYSAHGFALRVVSQSWATLIGIAAAMIVYISALLLLRVLTGEDIKMMTRSEKLAALLKKYKLIY